MRKFLVFLSAPPELKKFAITSSLASYLGYKRNFVKVNKSSVGNVCPQVHPHPTGGSVYLSYSLCEMRKKEIKESERIRRCLWSLVSFKSPLELGGLRKMNLLRPHTVEIYWNVLQSQRMGSPKNTDPLLWLDQWKPAAALRIQT